MAIKYPAYLYGQEDSSELPKKTRAVTDIFCGVVFALVLIAGVGTGVYGLVKGDTSNIASPYDSDGNGCGRGIATNFPYLFFNKPNQLFNGDNICVKVCPDADSTMIDCIPNSTFKS